LEKIDAATQRQIADTLTLAQQLGGVPFNFAGPDWPTAAAAFVREYGITHLVLAVAPALVSPLVWPLASGPLLQACPASM